MLYTIERVGETKQIQTKFGLKDKTGVIFKEFPNVWHDIWAKDLKVGQEVEGERTSREYNGKIYWTFNFPKKSEVAVNAVKDVSHRLQGIEITLGRILSYLELNLPRRTSDGKLMPFEKPIQYPDETSQDKAISDAYVDELGF